MTSRRRTWSEDSLDLLDEMVFGDENSFEQSFALGTPVSPAFTGSCFPSARVRPGTGRAASTTSARTSPVRRPRCNSEEELQQLAASVSTLPPMSRGAPARPITSTRTTTAAATRRSAPPPSRGELGLSEAPGNSHQEMGWFFTWNNYPENAGELLSLWPEMKTTVVGKEVAPETGTPHLQGIVIFKSRKTFKQMKELGPECHWQVVRNVEASIKYCRKEGDMLVDWDDRYGRASKSQITEAAYQAVLEGDATEMVASMTSSELFRNVKRIREAQAYGPMLLATQKRRSLPYVIWVYGGSGSGKTTFVDRLRSKLGESRTFCLAPAHNPSSLWYDGYTPLHEALVIDDLRARTFPLSEFLTLAGVLPRTVQLKGLSCPFNSSVIIVTAPEPPWASYSQAVTESDSVLQVVRRINLLVSMERVPLPGRTGPSTAPGGVSSSFQMPFQGIAATTQPTESAGHAQSEWDLDARLWGSLLSVEWQDNPGTGRVMWSRVDRTEPKHLTYQVLFEAEARGCGFKFE